MATKLLPLLTIFAAVLFKNCSGQGLIIRPNICDDGDGTYADKTYCEKFYQCRDGTPYSFTCPRTLVYNPELEVCDTTENYMCKFRCPLEDGPYIDPASCDKFYFCINRVSINMTCPHDFPHFNHMSRTCDTRENYECPTGLPPTTTAAATTTPPTTTMMGFIPDGLDNPLSACDTSLSEVRDCELTITTQITIDHDITMTNVKIDCNYIAQDTSGMDGCIRIPMDSSSALTIIIQDSTLTGNYAARFCYTSRIVYITMTNVVATQFSSDGLGGVFYTTMPGSRLHMENVVMRDNNSTSSGGCMFVQNHESVSITNSKFIRNSAVGGAGAVHVETADSLTITECNFESNQGDQGGAVSLANNAIVEITSTRFFSNSAVGANGGGGLHTQSDGDITITDCIFDGNTALSGKGNSIACYTPSDVTATLTISSSTPIYLHDIFNTDCSIQQS